MAEKINYENLDGLVYKRIKNMILSKELERGTKIIQNELAEELGVSRTPIRRALSQLAKEHLVEVSQRGLAYVRDFSRKEMTTIFEIREVLEGLACRKAAQTVNKEKLEHYKGVYREAMESITGDDWRAYQEGGSWGYYDQGQSNYRDGFQSPPTNWAINTGRKKAFFNKVAEIVGIR